MRVWSPFALSALAACVAACGSSSNNPFDDEDGGADAGVIARGDASSLGSDAAGTPGLDSATIPGIDAASSPGTDASPTPGTDAAPGPDSGAGMDAATVAMDAAPGMDAAPMGMDAAPGPDSGAGMDSAVMGMDATNGMEGGLKDAAGMEASPPDAAASDAGKTPGTAAANAVIVNPGTVHQSISGFGASTAWMGSAMTAAQADTAFSTTAGAGLSLDRVRINYQGNGTSAPETATALLAQARGARVWATPWTPPIADKSNDNDVEGTLTNPTAFASFLSTYVGAMKTAGVNLYAVSSQTRVSPLCSSVERAHPAAARGRGWLLQVVDITIWNKNVHGGQGALCGAEDVREAEADFAVPGAQGRHGNGQAIDILDKPDDERGVEQADERSDAQDGSFLSRLRVSEAEKLCTRSRVDQAAFAS